MTCTLYMFKALISLRIQAPLKTKETSLDLDENIWFVGSTLSLFKGVHWSVKN